MNLLQTYFNDQLVKAGFPDGLKIEYSLNHCQGDGVVFYGRLYQDDVERLFNRLNSSKRKQKMFSKLLDHILECSGISCIRLCKNWVGYRYSHWNCMELCTAEAEYQEFFSAGKRDWYFPKAKLGRYMALWNDFLSDLKEYVQTLSRQLERDGYRIIDATPYEKQVAYQFETKHYRIELVTEPYYFYDERPDLVVGDMLEVPDLCRTILAGETCFANLYAQVIDRRTGIALGEDFLGATSYHPNDRTFDGHKQALIRGAIEATRANDGLISRQAQLMQKYV